MLITKPEMLKRLWMCSVIGRHGADRGASDVEDLPRARADRAFEVRCRCTTGDDLAMRVANFFHIRQ
jgi:hypothetical protein